MKKHIYVLIMISFVFGLYTWFATVSANTSIVATSSGSDSLVDAIKQYSDITDADVNKYKLLWLGWLDVVPALTIGGYSTFKAHEAAGSLFKKAQASPWLQSLDSSQAPSWLTAYMPTPPDMLKSPGTWMAAAAFGAGLLSYKIFYPRIRSGVLNKVQNFIDACSELTVADKLVSEVIQIPEWSMAEPVAVCRALYNLESQARNASILLNQVGGASDPEVKMMYDQLVSYYTMIATNKNNWSNYYCNQFITAEQQAADLALRREGLQAQIYGTKIQNVKNVLSIIGKVGGFVYNSAKDMMQWSLSNPAPASLLGMAATYYWRNFRAVPPAQ